MATHTDTAASPSPTSSGFDNDNRQAATIGDSAREYVNRLRGGDMGSLPAILGLIFLFVVFASLNDRFLTTYNMANLVIQAGSIIVLAMGIVFVLLLGEIDLSAGVAGGASATIIALMLIDYDWTWWMATLAGVVVFLAVLVEAMIRRRPGRANPWGEGATTLEWTLSSPPPFHQFSTLPKIN